jgi:hypothetical protein
MKTVIYVAVEPVFISYSLSSVLARKKNLYILMKIDVAQSIKSRSATSAPRTLALTAV